MPIVAQCAQCGRGYTAAVASCPICGGACAPVTPEDALRIAPRLSEETTPPPQPVCPCCDGPPGPHRVEQQTRHQTESSLVPMRRKFLVTTVRVPGVCAACNRRLQNRRWLASVLLPLPLIVLLGVAVVVDSPAGVAFPVIYLFYVLPRIFYSWTDFLLYGRELSWKLGSYVPAADRESLANYPVGILHVLVRLAVLPVLALALFALASVLKQTAPAPSTAAATASESPAAATPAPARPPRATQVPLETGVIFFNTTKAIAVPVSDATIANPALAQPATALVTIEGKSLRVVKIYASEARIPVDVSYQLMTGPTVLAKSATVPSDGLLVVDWDMFFAPRMSRRLRQKWNRRRPHRRPFACAIEEPGSRTGRAKRRPEGGQARVAQN